MSYQDEVSEDKAMAVPQRTTNNEVEQLRQELENARKDAAVSAFLARASREFPNLPISDIRALTADRLKFEGGVLGGEDAAMTYLASRPFLQQVQPTMPSMGHSAINPASGDAHIKWAAQEARKSYLKSIFGRGSSSKVASQLAKQDIATYRKLRDEARRLDCYGK